MTFTPNIGIYIPADGDTNYGQSIAQGFDNIDVHDHSGGPNKGIPLGPSSIADGSITYKKLAADVTDPSTGIGVSIPLPNKIVALGFLNNVFNLGTAGLVVKNGAVALARSIVSGSPNIVVTNATGVAGNPTLNMPTTFTYPTQPGFIAGAAGQLGTTGNGTNYKVQFTAISRNQQAVYVGGATSTFTAPTTGFYDISSRIELGAIIAGSDIFYRQELWINGGGAGNVYILNKTNLQWVRNTSGEFTSNGNEKIYLSATDTVITNITATGQGANTISVLGGTFSAVLLN